MKRIESRSTTVWEGQLEDGSGMISAASGAFTLPVTWESRTEEPGGKTSPEELIAAAHATCYAMNLSATLAAAGSPPQRLEVTAVCGLEPKDGGGLVITSSNLSVRGLVPGLDQSGFEELARKGEATCPVSNALRGNLDIGLDAQLATG